MRKQEFASSLCPTSNEFNQFVISGFNPEIQSPYLFQEFWKFNLLTQRWSRVFNANTGNMPEELISNAVAIRDDVMLVYGGTGFPFGEKSSNKCSLLYPYAMPKQICLVETSGDKPEPQYGQAIVVHDRYLYVIGGTTGHEYTCDIYRFVAESVLTIEMKLLTIFEFQFRLDLISRVWECVYICNDILRDDDPKGRYRHEVAHDSTHIYILGGGTREHTFDLEKVPAFDFTRNKWTTIRTKSDTNAKDNGGYPEPRKFHSCVQQCTTDGIEVIIAGGFQSDAIQFDDIWKLNLRTYQWTRYAQTKLPKKLHFHDATIANNGCMYVFGGISGSRNNHLHKMWLKIPKLSDMCWEALQHYHPTLSKAEKTTLLQVGIPQNYAAQVERAKAVVYDF